MSINNLLWSYKMQLCGFCKRQSWICLKARCGAPLFLNNVVNNAPIPFSISLVIVQHFESWYSNLETLSETPKWQLQLKLSSRWGQFMKWLWNTKGDKNQDWHNTGKEKKIPHKSRLCKIQSLEGFRMSFLFLFIAPLLTWERVQQNLKQHLLVFHWPTQISLIN